MGLLGLKTGSREVVRAISDALCWLMSLVFLFNENGSVSSSIWIT